MSPWQHEAAVVPQAKPLLLVVWHPLPAHGDVPLGPKTWL
jgi:hypothetical protein